LESLSAKLFWEGVIKQITLFVTLISHHLQRAEPVAVCAVTWTMTSCGSVTS